jgi:hypothetical protein
MALGRNLSKKEPMTEPTIEEQLAIDSKFLNTRLRDRAGYTETTETERPNAEMNDLIRRTAGRTEPEPQEEN